MRKGLVWILAISVLIGSTAMAQTSCKRFTVSSSQGCAWCGIFNPFQNKKTVTTTYHFVCTDGTDSYSTQTTYYGCGTC